MSRPYELGRLVYMPNKDVYGFYIEIDPSIVEGKCVVRVFEQLECELFRGLRRVRSRFVRGILAGWFSELVRGEAEAIEVRCLALGDPYCEFLVRVKE